MKNRQICIFSKRLSALFFAFALLAVYSCDQPTMIVESDESDDQILLISQNTNSGIPIKDGPIDTTLSLNTDSALIITYKRYEDYSVKNRLVELFQISFIHKLDADTTLDYGSVTFAGMPLYRMYQQTPVGMAYEYRSMHVNNSDDSSYAPWLTDFRLDHRVRLTSKNSPNIKDFDLEIPTHQPNWIMNLDTGQIVSAANNLELVFRREMVKGTIIIIAGYGPTPSYRYEMEMVQSASKVTIPANYLQSVKGTLTDVKCQIAFEETLFLGSLASDDKMTFRLYLLPIFQFTRGSIMVRLND